jgi:hypothetical protein
LRGINTKEKMGAIAKARGMAQIAME